MRSDSHCRVTDEKNRIENKRFYKAKKHLAGPAISIRKHRRNSYTLPILKPGNA